MLQRWPLIMVVTFVAVLAAYGQSPFVVVDQVYYSGRPDLQIIVTDISNPDISTLRMYLHNLPSAPPPNWPYMSSTGYDLQNNNNVPNFPQEVRVFNGTIQEWSSGGQFQYFQDVGCPTCICPTQGKCLESFLDNYFPTVPSESTAGIADQIPDRWESIFFPLPTNGYEPPYNPGFWNNDAKTRDCNNCYNYGANKKNNQYAQPGFTGNRLYSEFSCPNVTAAAIADGLIPWPADVPCSNYDYKVALVMRGGVDYHWLRQDRGGNWSEKRGPTPASDKDDAMNPITDPRVTLMNGKLGIYNEFCTFMCVLANPNRVNIGWMPPPPAGCPK
jgi:hypothetical protein